MWSDTYITKVPLNEIMSSLVHRIVVMVLQRLNAVQSSQLFNQQAEFLHLTKFLCSLKSHAQQVKPSDLPGSLAILNSFMQIISSSPLTMKMLLMASSMTRMTLASLTCSRLMIASRAPHCTRVTTCSTVPPLVKFVTAHTASLWVLKSPWELTIASASSNIVICHCS